MGTSSHSPARLGDARTDLKPLHIYGEGDTSLYYLRTFPDRTDASLSTKGLPDCDQRQLKIRTPMQVGVPEEVATSGSNGVSERHGVANLYVDSPSSPSASRTECCDASDDVKPTPSPSVRSAPFSIICEHCGGCRCERCAGLRTLPGIWCGPRCGYCTPARVVDVMSCVCCVQAVVYHCSMPADQCEVDVDGSPFTCSGSPSQCRRRWVCLALLGGLGCLPCLLLYWPLRALLAVGRAVYNAAGRRRACRCGRSTTKKTQVSRRILFVDADSSNT